MIKYLLGILFGILIILFNFRLLVFDYDLYYNLSSNDNRDYAKNLIGYLKEKNNLNLSYFNEKETTHLADVKSLIIKIIYFFYLLLLVFILFLLKYYRKIFDVFIFSFLFILLILIFINLIDFSSLFYKFHLMFFDNNLWMMNPETDNLVNAFPENFFYKFAFKIIYNSLVMSLVFFVLGGGYYVARHIAKVYKYV